MKYYDKPVGPIFTFVFWLVCLIIICIVGISNVFAASYDALSFTAQLYDNYGPSLSSVTTSMSNMYYTGTIPTMTANTSGAAWGISSPIPLLANHTYSLSVRIEGPYGGNLALSTYNRIGVGTSLANAKSSYENNSNVTENYSNVIPKNMTIQFAFTPSINATYIVFPFATTYTGNNQEFRIYNVVIDDLGASGVSQSTINNSLNKQTNELNNSITNSTNTITENSNNNRDAIINNQNANNQALIQNDNANTDKLIEDNKKNFQTCRDSVNLLNISSGTFSDSQNQTSTIQIVKSNKKITINGSLGDYSPGSRSFSIFGVNGGTSFTNYGNYFSNSKSITLTAGTYTFSIQNITGTFTSNRVYLFIYNASGSTPHTRITSINLAKSTSNSFTLTENTDVYITLEYNSSSTFDNYSFNLQLEEGTQTPYEPYGEKICTNKLDEQNETSKGIFGKIKELFSWLTNDDDADVSGAGNVAGWLPAGPVDSLITLPLTMLQNINTSLNKTCSPLNVNLPYVNKSVEIPCLNAIFNQITGLNSFWTWVGLIASVMILFRYLVNLYNYFDKLTDLQAQYLSDWGGV